MNNKGVGSIFCLISAILLGFRYVTAAIFMSSTESWSAELFTKSLEYTGPVLLIAAIIALVLGLCFIALGIVKDNK